MIQKTIYLLTLICFVGSCGPRTRSSNKQSDTISVQMTPDPNKIRYLETNGEVGPKVFKENCAGCHCGPSSSCEPPYTGELRPFFDGLPIDSLRHLEAYIKNSTETKKGLRKSPFITDDGNNYNHIFEKNLSDSLIKTVVEYIWTGYKHAD